MNNTNPYPELEAGIFAALETYSNVHRGSGHFSKTTTRLYEKAREIVLDYLGLPGAKYTVLFFTPRRAEAFTHVLKQGSFVALYSREFGLNLGVAAFAVRKKNLPAGIPQETGGGTTKLYGKDWVIWAKAPDKFEAGTPAIINIIAFAKALLLIKKYGKDVFREGNIAGTTASQILFDDSLAECRGYELLETLRNTLVGRSIKVPTIRGPQPFISLDNSASTPTFSPILDAFLKTYRQPESIREKVVGEVKKICAETLGAPYREYEFFFTSNTTESINLLAQSLTTDQYNESTTLNAHASQNQNSSGKSSVSYENIEPVILSSVLEHSSNDLPWRHVPGNTMVRLGVDNMGFFNLGELEATLSSYNKEHAYGRKRVTLVALSGASNVLGSCNDLAAIGSLTKKYGACFFVDAAQLAAHRKIDMHASGIDCLAFSAHKVYAPFGTGVLIARKGILQISPEDSSILHATAIENAGGIAALGKALHLLSLIGFSVIEKEEIKLTNNALSAMLRIPGIKIHGMAPETPVTSANKIGVIGFEIKDKMPARIAGKLARRGGIGVRMGCLCAHLIIKQLAGFTPFTEKLQRFIIRVVPWLNLQGITRMSFGIQNTGNDVEVMITELTRIAGKSENKNHGAGKQASGSENKAIHEKIVKQQMAEFIREREQKVFQ